MKIYYKIWVDCIVKTSSVPGNEKLWKFLTMLLMSVTMALNYSIVITILEVHVFKVHFYDLEKLLPYNSKIQPFGFIILYFLPMLLINYFLIFFRDRYKKLLEKYNYHNGKLFAKYFIIALGIPFILLLSMLVIKMVKS